jgi:hypothetical protein
MLRKTWVTSKNTVHNIQKTQNSMRFKSYFVKDYVAKMRFCEQSGPPPYVFWGVHCSFLKILNPNIDIFGEPKYCLWYLKGQYDGQ